jgi:hypothetical protein
LFLAGYSGLNGGFRWAKGVFSSAAVNQGFALALDPLTGNVVATGNIQGSVNLGCGAITPTGSTLFLAAYNSAGTCQWAKTFPNGDSASGGFGRSIAIDTDGVIALTGQINGGVQFDNEWLISSGGSRNLFVATFAPGASPTYRWGKVLAGSGDSNGSGIAFDSNGHVLPCGFFIQTKDFGGISATGSSSGSSFLAEYNK